MRSGLVKYQKVSNSNRLISMYRLPLDFHSIAWISSFVVVVVVVVVFVCLLAQLEVLSRVATLGAGAWHNARLCYRHING